jgi:molybdopterin-binding protein
VIDIAGLSARVGSFRLQEVTFVVPAGAYGVVIGPAGSGKTTLLETIGGIVRTTAGVVRLAGRDVTGLPPEERGVGLVYQHGYLFPHLTVERNVTYAAADAASARDVAARFGVDVLWNREVRSLSGGERQLVALTRALARGAGVLLLDEPFGALDPRRRAQVRREVRALHRERALTVLQVTHDFTEAGLLGDMAVLLDAGRVLQTGSPDEVFRKPASPYIAEFLGAENVFAGTVMGGGGALLQGSEPDGGNGAPYRMLEFRVSGTSLSIVAVGDAEPGPGYAVLRAEEIVVSNEPAASSARNCFRGRVQDLATLGALTRVTIDVAGLPLVASLTTRSARELRLAPGVEIYACFKAMAVHLC